MPAKVCLVKPGVCRLRCVEFIYTSVSRDDTLSLVTTADRMAAHHDATRRKNRVVFGRR